MKIKDILIYIFILSIGLFSGWLIFGNKDKIEEVHTEATISQIWNCSMHPQVRQNRPGKCPICAMDLVPLIATSTIGEIVDSEAIVLSDEALALANIQTMDVNRSLPTKEICLYGTIQINERLLRSQVAHINGRIEKLFVASTGESIRKGQVIATIYSPDVLNAQQELLEALKLQSSVLGDAARKKLRLWKLTENQIASIEQSGEVSPLMEIIADVNGIVINRRTEQGDYVSVGNVIYDLADISSVWAVFDVYESDIPYLKIGDKIEYTVQALPENIFQGKITFIEPILDKISRTAKVRVETSNIGLQLKPEMHVSALIRTPLKQYADKIVLPKTAVLWTGRRSVVYVKQAESNIPVFKLREIELGPSLGDSYVILSGIEDGEQVVTNGTFVIDASAQLEGKSGMMDRKIIQDNKYPSAPVKEEEISKKYTTIIVQGKCDMCRERIESTAKKINGVNEASWNVDTKKLRLQYDPAQTSVGMVAKAIDGIGYDVDKYKANDTVYNTLPPCCRYRDKVIANALH